MHTFWFQGVLVLLKPGSGVELFCAFYTFGNLCSLFSSLFLAGPCNQLKAMFDPSRWMASVMMIFFLIMTLIAALHWERRDLALIYCVGQFLSIMWYTLSYIPLGREAVKGAVVFLVEK